MNASFSTCIATLLTALFCSPVLADARGRHAEHSHGASSQQGLPSVVVVPLDADTLAKFSRHTVQARVHEVDLHCEGVSLVDVLKATPDAMPERVRGPHLARYVLAGARDGYRAVFALAELAPEIGGSQVYIVDRCAGEALDEHTGPLRLLVPGDARPARSVRQLQTISVHSAP